MKATQVIEATRPTTKKIDGKTFLRKNWHRMFVIFPIAALLLWDMAVDLGLQSARNPFLILLLAGCLFELFQFAKGRNNQFITKWIDPSHGYTRVDEDTWVKNEDF